MDYNNSINSPIDLKENIVFIENLNKSYTINRKKSLILSNINLKIKEGEFICILGPSGCGKSTLLDMLGGFTFPDSGNIIVNNNLVKKPGPERGFVFQKNSLIPWLTLEENVGYGLKLKNESNLTIKENVARFMKLVGLENYSNLYPHQLSGGMQQRGCIIRSLINNPKILLMDEPFGALDSQTRIIMQENLLKLWREFKITVVFVTHDIDEAVFLADRILLMSTLPGKIKKDLKIDLPRPRDKETTDSSRFIELRQICHSLIREESLKAFEKQNQL